jgi:hypothetical protein
MACVTFALHDAGKNMSPIAKLITERCSGLGISYAELAQRCGYKNQSKGLRRVHQLLAGDTSRTKALIDLLPAALNVEASIVENALWDTEYELRQNLEAAERRAFKPHAIVICERPVPEPIWVACVIGIDRILRIDFAECSMPVTYVRQAMEGVQDKQRRWGSTSLPAFGQPTAIAINYSLDRAVVFNLTGEAVETFNRPFQVGCTLSLGRNLVAPDKVQLLFS